MSASLIKCQTNNYNNKNNFFLLVYTFPHSRLHLMKCLQNPLLQVPLSCSLNQRQLILNGLEISSNDHGLTKHA